MSEHLKHIAARFLDVTICPVVRYIVSSAMVPGTQAAIRKEINELRAHILATTPGNPCAQGFKTYAQIDEDGILEDIFDRIPAIVRLLSRSDVAMASKTTHTTWRLRVTRAAGSTVARKASPPSGRRWAGSFRQSARRTPVRVY